MDNQKYEAIYEEGYACGVKGGRCSDNPYEAGSQEALAWREGQSDGNDNALSAGL